MNDEYLKRHLENWLDKFQKYTGRYPNSPEELAVLLKDFQLEMIERVFGIEEEEPCSGNCRL
jgi:hypothetical protein